MRRGNRSPSNTKRQIAALKPIRVELVGDNTAIVSANDAGSPQDLVACGHAPVLDLCWRLITLGVDAGQPIIAYRKSNGRDVECLRIRSVREGADHELNSKGTGFVRRRSQRPEQGGTNHRAAARQRSAHGRLRTGKFLLGRPTGPAVPVRRTQPKTRRLR